MPFHAIGPMEADGVFLACGSSDAKAVAICPRGCDEGAVFKFLEGLGGSGRGVEKDCKKESDPDEGLHGMRMLDLPLSGQ